MHERKSLSPCTRRLALRLRARQMAVRGTMPDWLSGQAARGRIAATQAQSEVLGA
jgi:hypothetical protein